MRTASCFLIPALLAASGCAARYADLAGSWMDESGACYAFDKRGQIVGIRDHDDEVFQVQSSTVTAGQPHFVYKVPSTSYLVTQTVTAIDTDAITVEWSNDRDMSGTEQYRRSDCGVRP